MRLKLREVLEHGHDNERVVIDVLENANLTYYLLCDTTYTSANTISNKLRHMYWFAKQDVIKGDLVVLYTKKGTHSVTRNANGSTSYFYYWQLDSNVWNDTGDGAVLFEIATWDSLKARP